MVLKLAGKAAYDYVKKQLKKKKPKLKRTTEAQNKKFKAKMNKVQKDLQSGSKDKIQAAERKLFGPPGPKKTPTSHQMMERNPGYELKKVKGKWTQVPFKKAGGSISKYYSAGGNVITGR